MFSMSMKDLEDHLRLFMAELLGTFILVLVGLSAVAQYTLMNSDNRNFVSVALGFGLGLILAILVVGRVSGAHLNPAVTLALCVFRKHPWSKLPLYWLAQYLGALLGALAVYLVHADGLNYERSSVSGEPAGDTLLASFILTTYPRNHEISAATLCFDQILGTALLVLVIFAATDVNNFPVPPHALPFYLGSALTAIHLGMAYNGGAPVNPARDLSPRLLAQMLGLKTITFEEGGEDGTKTFYPDATPFSYHDFYFWMPWIIPHIGALVGGLIYYAFIEFKLPGTKEENNDEKNESRESDIDNPPSPISIRTQD